MRENLINFCSSLSLSVWVLNVVEINFSNITKKKKKTKTVSTYKLCTNHNSQLDTLQIKLSTTSVHRLRIFMFLCSAARTEWLLSHSILSVSRSICGFLCFAMYSLRTHSVCRRRCRRSRVLTLWYIYSHIIYGKLHSAHTFLARTHLHASIQPSSRHTRPTCMNMYRRCALMKVKTE